MAASQNPSQSSLASRICSDIASIFSKPTHPHSPPLDVLVSELSAVATRKARVFLYGVGREGLMLKALCMRLAHLGLSAHQVFDMNAPPIAAPDLLIASAGPGGFSTVDAICSVARSNGAKVLLLTAQPETGSSVKHADVFVTFRRRRWRTMRKPAGGQNLGLYFRWEVCTKEACSFCLRWWCIGWVRYWERAQRPSDHATPISNERMRFDTKFGWMIFHSFHYSHQSCCYFLISHKE